MRNFFMLNGIVKNITPYYNCKFESYNKKINQFWYDTFKSSKKIEISFGGAVRFAITREGKNNYSILHCGSTVIITSTGIRFIPKDAIMIRTGPSGIHFMEDKTIDAYCNDYDTEDCYFNLITQYPDVPEEVLQTVLYFCINPVPKGVYLEIDCTQLALIEKSTSYLKEII